MKYIQHAKAVAWLFGFWCLAVVWLWPHAVMAGTLSADVKVYDWWSLLLAAAIGVLGGILALIVALATDHRALLEVTKEGLRNITVSPFGGMVAYLVLEAVSSLGWVVLPAVLRFLVIGACGYAGIAFFVWAKVMAGRVAGAFGDWLIKKGQP